MKKLYELFRKPGLNASANVRRSARGTTYMETIVSIAIIGICTLIIFNALVKRKELRQRTSYEERAILALISEADLIRSGAASLNGGKHAFTPNTGQGFPRTQAFYTISKSDTPGCLKAAIAMTWEYRGWQGRRLEIYVHQ